jgi:hypothetical protein
VTVSWNWADADGAADIDPNHCTTSSTSSGEGTVTLQATCADLAGNQGSASYTVKVDKTAPSNVVGAANSSPKAIANVSNASPITVTVPAHGFATGDSVVVAGVGGNTTANGTWTITVVDANTFTLNGSASSGPYTSGGTALDVPGGWFNAPVTVGFFGQDATSGIASCTSTSYSGPDSATASVMGTCADALSGIPAGACPSDQVLSAEGSAVSSTAQTVTDVAGNTSTPSNVITVKIDTTAPATAATAVPGTLPNGLPLITVDGTATVKDTAGATLGTQAFTCFDTPGLKVALAASDKAGGSGVTTLTYAATDLAGNQEPSRSQSIVVSAGFACAGPTPTFSLPSTGPCR